MPDHPVKVPLMGIDISLDSSSAYCGYLFLLTYVVECARLGQLTLHDCEISRSKHAESFATIIRFW